MYCNANLLHTNAQMTCTAKVKTKKTIELDLAIFFFKLVFASCLSTWLFIYLLYLSFQKSILKSENFNFEVNVEYLLLLNVHLIIFTLNWKLNYPFLAKYYVGFASE